EEGQSRIDFLRESRWDADPFVGALVEAAYYASAPTRNSGVTREVSADSFFVGLGFVVLSALTISCALRSRGFPRHSLAPARHRSRAADVLPQRQSATADQCTRQCADGASGRNRPGPKRLSRKVCYAQSRLFWQNS